MNKPLNNSFRNYATREEAEEISDLLAKEKIDSNITRDSGDLDYVFQGESPAQKYELHINESDLEKAKLVLTELAKESLIDLGTDYYLYSFTDDELIDVLIKRNEWSELDVLLSQKILGERGVEIVPANIERKREIRDLELEQPERGQVGWIIFGYIMSFMGGLIGLFLGYSLLQAKKKLPNGSKAPAYSESIRRHGKIIFFISLTTFIVFSILRITEKLIIL